MHRINQLLGLVLTLFMLGSSSGIATFTGEIRQDPATSDSTPVAETMDGSEITEPDDTDQAEAPPEESSENPAEPVELIDGAVDQVPIEEPDITENPSTGPPADTEPVIEVPAEEAPAVTSGEAITESEEEVPVEEMPAVTDDEVNTQPEEEVPAEEVPAVTGDEVITESEEEAPVESAPVATGDELITESEDEALAEEAPAVTGDEVIIESEEEVPAEKAPALTGDEIITESEEEVPAEKVPAVTKDEVNIEPAAQIVEGNNISTPTVQDEGPAASIQAATVQYTIIVSDFDNNRINGATVSISDWDGDNNYGTKSTINGEVTFELVRGVDYYMAITAPGFFPEEMLGLSIVEGYEPDDHNVFMYPKMDGKLTVRVVNRDDGSPVVGATVAVTDSDGNSKTTGPTLADGVFTSSADLPAGTLYFTVSHPAYESSGSSIYIEGDSNYGDFQLVPIVGGTITFTAYDWLNDDETPLPNVSIHIESWADGTEYTGTTDATGNATFADIPGGEYSVTATLDGFEERSQKLYVRGDAAEELPMRAIVETPGKLTISTYETGTGTSIDGVLVVVFDENLIEVDRGTSKNGQFVTKELPFGTYTANLTKDGFHEGESGNLYVDGDNTQSVSLRKIKTGTVTIQILDVSSDQPIANAEVTVSHDDLAEALVLTTNSSGIVTFPATSFGYYSVEVSKDGYAETSRTVDFVGDETITMYLRALEPGTATISVRDMDSNALLSGVRVQVMDWATEEVLFDSTTLVNGTVTTGELAEDGYRLRLTKDGYFSVDSMLTVQGNVENTYHIETIKPGVITIQALTQDNVPVPGATVFIGTALVDGLTDTGLGIGVRYAFGDTIFSGSTNSDGRMVSPVLESGSYMVVISADGYEQHAEVVHLNGDYVVSANLTVGSSEPFDPETPMEPTDPVNPTDPTDPTEPTEPTNPTDPSNPTNPTDPADPTDPKGEDDQDDQDNWGQPGETGTLSLSFHLCTDEICNNTSGEYDGYTVSWTVTPLDTAATREIDEAKMAAVGMSGSPVSSSMMQASQSFIITGVLQDGIATGVSEPLLVGNYNVCLLAKMTGPNGEVVSIAGQTTCNDLNLTAGGSTSLPFGGIVAANPDTHPDANEGGSNPVAEEPTDVPSGEISNDSVAQADDSPKSDSSVAGLPNTGAGTNEGTSGFLASAALVTLLIATLAFGTRRDAGRS